MRSRTILSKVDFLDQASAELWVEIDRVIAPFANEVDLLRAVAGIDRRAAEGIIAEIGVDMSRFPTSGHLASWAGQCPDNHEPDGTHRGGRPTKGSKWLGALQAECAAAVGHLPRRSASPPHRADRLLHGQQGCSPLHPGRLLAHPHQPRPLPRAGRRLGVRPVQTVRLDSQPGDPPKVGFHFKVPPRPSPVSIKARRPGSPGQAADESAAKPRAWSQCSIRGSSGLRPRIRDR